MRVLGKFGMISGNVLGKGPRIFFGFDEAFIVREGSYRNLDVSLFTSHYTSDILDLRESAIPDNLRLLLAVPGVEQYASDGLGLNVITKRSATIARIRSELLC